MDLMPFQPDTTPIDPPVMSNADIPKEFDIFSQPESDFLPNGKRFEDLTPEEMMEVTTKYRFAYFRSGMSQVLSGMTTRSDQNNPNQSAPNQNINIL